MPLNNELIQVFAIVFFACFGLSLMGTRAMVWLARHFDWTAKANSRSSHAGKLAFGGGVSVLLVTLGGWAIRWPHLGLVEISVLSSALVLAVLSWVDDLRPLPSSIRFALQLCAITIVLYLLPSDQNIIPLPLPLFADRLVAGFFWIWFINLFNFMDGIDGMAGVETFSVSLGILIIATLVGMGANDQYLAVIIMGAIAGFLPWNWHQAKIMLGDIGSIPLGFLLGYLLIQMALSGHLLGALILPAYFATDASLTLLRRVFTGEKFWRPHSTHFYQRAVQAGMGHDGVVIRVGVANAALVGCAILSLNQPLWALVGAIVIIVLLIGELIRIAKGK